MLDEENLAYFGNVEKRLANPRGVKYEMHFVDDTIVNVFTLGGHIIFFKGMYEICETNSEMASIISHEIAHNELGHSTLALKKQKKAKTMGKGRMKTHPMLMAIQSSSSPSRRMKREIRMMMMSKYT